MKDITEAKIRRAIRIAIVAKKIEQNPIIEVEESYGINFDDSDVATRAASPFYEKLKDKLDIKKAEIEKAKNSVFKREYLGKFE